MSDEKNYFEQARRGCLKIISTKKAELKSFVLINKNQTKLFKDINVTPEYDKFRRQWKELDALEKQIQFFKVRG